jgi:putative SOS response-associated peptidase YedK
MRWGLVPVWVKDPQDFPLIINARTETIAEKPAFRGGLRHHRCIMPANGYYEWKTGPDGKKQPYYITRADGAPIAFAGVYSTWLGADGSEIDTVAIATAAASGDMKDLHDRVPVIIPDADLNGWLDIKSFDEKQARGMLKPLPEDVLRFQPVSTRINSVRNDDERLIEPVTEERPKPPKQGELF